VKPGVKIQFSAKELRLINDTSFLLSKRVITEKTCNLLHGLKETLAASPIHRTFPFPAGTDFHQGKITRGENLKGLPYLVLDFPRLFEQDNIFAFRTMFWWGNYFSFTLHLKGKALKQFGEPLLKNLSKQKKKDLLVYLGEDEWEHDLSNEGYVPYSKELNEIIQKQGFLKLSRKIAVSDFEKLNTEGLKTYNLLLSPSVIARVPQGLL